MSCSIFEIKNTPSEALGWTLYRLPLPGQTYSPTHADTFSLSEGECAILALHAPMLT